MDITGQHTPAPPRELKLQTNLQSISGLVDDIEGEFGKLKDMGAEEKDPVLLRFKLRTFSALQKTVKIISRSDAAQIPEIAALLSPPEDSKAKNRMATLSKLLKRKDTRSGEVNHKSRHRERKKNNETKNMRIHVRQAMGAYLKSILDAKSQYKNGCVQWYRDNGVLIKTKLQTVGERKSTRESGAFPQVIGDLHKTLDCSKQLVEACRRVATTGDKELFDEMYAKPETHLDMFVAFFKEHAEVLSLPNINMQQLNEEEGEEAKDLAIADEMAKFVESMDEV